MNIKRAFSSFVFFLAITQPAFATDPRPDDYLKFLPRQIYDIIGQLNAFTVLVREGSRLEGSIYFNPVPSWAILLTFTATSPGGTIGAEYTGTEPLLAWSQGPLGNAPEGQIDFGNRIVRPADGPTFFRNVISPAWQKIQVNFFHIFGNYWQIQNQLQFYFH